jgi:thioredoxin-dependent peroxiredoxin
VLNERDRAPDFSVMADHGKQISAADYRGRNLILYFYPKANTSGCTHEAVEFSRAIDEFRAANTAIVGCSADSVEAQSKFKEKYKLNFPLLSDTDFQVIEAYGARRMKSFFGKSFLGIVRMTFWIGPDGTIQKIWNRVTPKGHAEEVLAAVQARSLEPKGESSASASGSSR